MEKPDAKGSEVLGGWGVCFERRKVRDQEAIVCQTQQAEPSAQRKNKQQEGGRKEEEERRERERESWETGLGMVEKEVGRRESSSAPERLFSVSVSGSRGSAGRTPGMRE